MVGAIASISKILNSFRCVYTESLPLFHDSISFKQVVRFFHTFMYVLRIRELRMRKRTSWTWFNSHAKLPRIGKTYVKNESVSNVERAFQIKGVKQES